MYGLYEKKKHVFNKGMERFFVNTECSKVYKCM